MAAVQKATSIFKESRVLILAVGKGAKLSRAGTKNMMVDATADATLSNSEVSCNMRLISGRHGTEIPTPHMPMPGLRLASVETLSLYAATERLRINIVDRFTVSYIDVPNGTMVAFDEVVLESRFA